MSLSLLLLNYIKNVHLLIEKRETIYFMNISSFFQFFIWIKHEKCWLSQLTQSLVNACYTFWLYGIGVSYKFCRKILQKYFLWGHFNTYHVHINIIFSSCVDVILHRQAYAHVPMLICTIYVEASRCRRDSFFSKIHAHKPAHI